MPKKKVELNFEQALQQLETLVNTLENGELPLEESLSTFEQGIKLSRECQQQLAAAEQKVSLLTGDITADGHTIEQVDFDHRPQD